jgi:indolepyruvate decarboxylase
LADIAKSIGGHGERVTTHAALINALKDALNRRGMFSLIEAMLPRGATSDTVARFVGGFKGVRAKTA